MKNAKGSGRAARVVTLLIKVFPLLTMVLISVTIGILLNHVQVEDILRYVPANLLLAAITLLGIYALKSLSVFFPLVVLYISAGILFPPLYAVAVNLGGLLICISIPYWMGRMAGSELMETLLLKYKKAHYWDQLRYKNEWFASYILRVVNLLPGDLVSLLLGASRTRYVCYLCGSLAGLVPTMLASTFLGIHITQPGSWQFLSALGMSVVLSVASVVLYRYVLIRGGAAHKRQL